MVNNEKGLVEQLNDSTKKMDKKNLKLMLKDLETAYKKSDRKKLDELSANFKEISDCLGNEDENALKNNLETINEEISKNGATALNIAKARNTQAKLSIIKYKPAIDEASTVGNYHYPVLNKKLNDKRSLLFVGGSLITMFSLMAGCSIKNKVDNDNIESTLVNSTAIYSTTTEEETTNYSSETIEETTISTGDYSDYSLQTLDVDYSSPTRNTNKSSGKNGKGTGNGKNGNNPTIKHINPTHNHTDVSVISAPTTTKTTKGTTAATTKTTKTTEPTHTSAIPTNSNGNKVDGSGKPVETSYIAPTGTDPLPVEPTKVTLSSDDLMTDPTTKATTAATKATTTTEPTKAPKDPKTTTEPTKEPTKAPTNTPEPTKSTEPVSTTIEVPVVTVDPNDPANVKEDSRQENKVLSLRMR